MANDNITTEPYYEDERCKAVYLRGPGFPNQNESGLEAFKVLGNSSEPYSSGVLIHGKTTIVLSRTTTVLRNPEKVRKGLHEIKDMGFKILREMDVSLYLVEHIDLIDILKRLCEEVKRRFSTAKDFEIDLFTSREDQSDKEIGLHPVFSKRKSGIFDELMSAYNIFAPGELESKTAWLHLSPRFRRSE